METAPSVVYKIHPAIGIARVGNADSDQFFIGPEIPGMPPTGDNPGTTVPPFKDSRGKIKPQAARFHIWEYKLSDGKYQPIREISLFESNVVSIKWTVHLANCKASFNEFDGEAGESKDPKRRRNQGLAKNKLDIDPGPREISGESVKGIEFRKGSSANPEAETWPDPPTNPPIDYLGELRTDDGGRLIVIGGKGTSATNVFTICTDYYNNDHWFDDVSDGPVKAQVTVKNAGSQVVTYEAAGAWIIVGPPDFAPSIANVVTLYDTLYDMAARELEIPTDNALYDTELRSLKDLNQELKMEGRTFLQDYRPSFNEEIYPILNRGAEVGWVFEPARHAHNVIGENPNSWPKLSDPDKANSRLRDLIMSRVRPTPTIRKPGPNENMPKLLGDAYKDPNHPRYRLSLTHTQYALLEQWHKGNFDKPASTPTRGSQARAISPAGLDKAALENCVGGPFHPGIEVGWQIRHKDLFSEPFRINHNARSTYRRETEKIMPGHFTRQMAVPWQADFRECKSEKLDNDIFGWWPAQRPDYVFESESRVAANKMVPWHRATADHWPLGDEKDPTAPSYGEMIANFFKLGFVIKKGSNFIETERASNIP